jgi:hypothetical protein
MNYLSLIELTVLIMFILPIYNFYFHVQAVFFKVNHEINILLHIGSISLNMNFFPMFLTLNFFVFCIF